MRRVFDLPLIVILMGIGALAMFVPAFHAFVLRDYAVARPFFYSGTMFLILVALLGLATAANRPGNQARSHLVAMLATFTALPLMLAVPFNEAVPDTGLFNAWWEMVSSLTTTGATLYDPARLASSLHLWRALVGWMGGFFVLVMAVAVMAPMRIGGFEVLTAVAPSGYAGNERPGPIMRNVDPSTRIVRFAGALFPIYAALTFALWVALLLAGDPALVALCHAMSTLSTSGISPIGGTAYAHSGLMGEILVLLFMVPALSRRLWPGGGELRATERLIEDPELRLAAALVVLVPGLLFLRHWIGALDVAEGQDLRMAAQALWGGVFTVLSFLTTTGFESHGWAEARGWSGLGTPGMILAGLAITGGGVATTAGGVKLLRVYALLRHGERELERLVHPSSVGGGGVVARRLRREGAFMSWIFFMLFAMAIAVVMMALGMAGIAFEPAMVLAISALSNTGPLATLAVQEPLSWTILGADAKAVLAAAMVLGRLETLAIIALLNPEFWRS
jgi:trk system potassium uptake protein